MKAILVLCLVVFTSTVHAANMRFLKDSVLTEFSAAEIQDFKQFIRQSLDTLEDQKIVTWKASSGPLKGKFKAKFTYQSNGLTCRRSLLLISNGKSREPFKFDICKSGEQWAIQNTPAKSFNSSDWKLLRASVEQALDNPDIALPLSWHNQKTGNSGSHVVLTSETQQGQSCRTIAVTIFDNSGRSSNGVYTMCKDKNAEWKRKIEEL